LLPGQAARVPVHDLIDEFAEEARGCGRAVR
jgi:hypothetical protein